MLDSSTTLVVGANGSGKTTFIAALIFALYGETYKAINKNQIVNSINGKQCVCEVEFSSYGDEYKIVRGVKPNILDVFKNGEKLQQEADLRTFQEYIETHILKISYKTFIQTVVLGSTSYMPFMSLKPQQRRELIEDLLDLHIFSAMNALVKEANTDNEKALNAFTNKADILSHKINVSRQFHQRQQEDDENFVQIRNSKINDLKFKSLDTSSKITEVTNHIAVLEAEDAQKRKIVQERQELDKLQSELDIKCQMVQKDLAFFDKNETCPSCKQGIEHAHKQSLVDKKRANLQQYDEVRAKIAKKRVRVDREFEEWNFLVSEIRDSHNKRQSFIYELDSVKKQIKFLEEEIVNRNTNLNENNLSALQAEFENNETYRVGASEQKSVYTVLLSVLKDNGLKAEVIKEYIPVINQLISSYLLKMNFICEFELNENFEESIKSRYKDEYSYASFSEGEKMRIDIAILFAWREVARLRNSVQTNLLVFDEIGASAMDAEGVDLFFDIISDLKKYSNIVFITHDPKIIEDDTKFERKFQVQKVDNFSNYMLID